MTEPNESAQSGHVYDRRWSGVCIGGPLDGRVEESRFPRGFLLVDKQERVVWIYDLVDEYFRVRSEAGDELDDEKRKRAATQPAYDVRALDA